MIKRIYYAEENILVASVVVSFVSAVLFTCGFIPFGKVRTVPY